MRLYSTAIGCMMFSLLVISCGPSKVITTAQNLEPLSPKELISKVNKRLPEISWLDGRAMVSIQIKGNTQKFSSQIRLKRDSLFLANGKKISMEGGRIQISRDSFYLLNRVQNTIEIRSYETVAEAYAIPLDFDQFISMLLGQPIFQMDAEKYGSRINGQNYLLEGRHGHLSVDYTIKGSSFDLIRMDIKDELTRQKCVVQLGEYQDYNGVTLAGLRTFTFDNGVGQVVSMKVDFSKIELNVPKRFKFEIPPRFVKLD